jgi:MSHA pilin protein MshA
MKKINKQAGFTLIELIMVIVILGVLSAFALPRFADLGGEARTASINGLNGAVKSAANIAHAQWLADGGTAALVTLEGTDIDMVNGYPDNTAIDLAAQVTADDYTVDDTTSATATTFDVIGAPTPATCRVTYTEAAVDGSPTYVLLKAGC